MEEGIGFDVDIEMLSHFMAPNEMQHIDDPLEVCQVADSSINNAHDQYAAANVENSNSEDQDPSTNSELGKIQHAKHYTKTNHKPQKSQNKSTSYCCVIGCDSVQRLGVTPKEGVIFLQFSQKRPAAIFHVGRSGDGG